ANYVPKRGKSSGKCGFKKLKIEPGLQRTLTKHFGSVADVIKGVQLKDRISFYASDSNSNLWEIKIPDLSILTHKSGSSSSAL
ncbi:hypothetical protein, partial [uncultured Gimesia sp.]|uniref:hypothetical protein n=1 Tax=uncultured Gimesia sp. TaxID=1678688 RepID=UPI00260FC453